MSRTRGSTRSCRVNLRHLEVSRIIGDFQVTRGVRKIQNCHEFVYKARSKDHTRGSCPIVNVTTPGPSPLIVAPTSSLVARDLYRTVAPTSSRRVHAASSSAYLIFPVPCRSSCSDTHTAVPKQVHLCGHLCCGHDFNKHDNSCCGKGYF